MDSDESRPQRAAPQPAVVAEDPEAGRSNRSEQAADAPGADGADRETNETREEATGEANATAHGETNILTPSRLRVDSRVVLTHSTAQWLTNAVFATLILLKLDDEISVPWWLVFLPTWLNHLVHIPLQVVVLMAVEHFIHRQLGPPPPSTATAGLHLQYSILRIARVRSHIIDHVNALIDSTTMLIVKVVFCWMLETDQLGSISFRLLFTPFWVSWAATAFLNCLKDRTERMFGSTRDLMYIFLLFVAFKVDGMSSYSWRVVFVIPWIWFSALFLLAFVVLILLLFARVWSRVIELLLPLGFFCLLASTVPQFVSYLALVQRLDGDSTVDNSVILIPNAISWFLMWLSSLILAAGLLQKERIRDGLLASGAVWTAHEAVARRLHRDREAAQRKVDNLTEEEIVSLVDEMMAGKAKPGRLKRVGNTLYKRITSFNTSSVETAAAAGKQGGEQAAGAGTSAAHAASNAASTPQLAAGPAAVMHTLHSVPEAPTPDSTSSSGAVLSEAPVIAGLKPSPSRSGLGMATATPLAMPLESATAQDLPRPDHLQELPGQVNASKDVAVPPVRLSNTGLPAQVHGSGAAATSVSPADIEAGPPPSRPSRIMSARSRPSSAVAHSAAAAGKAALEGGVLASALNAQLGLERETDMDLADDTCIICYDRQATCVFLECGHGGFCRRCAYLLFVRPPNECPTCRQRIEQVVELEEVIPIGQAAPVK